MPADRLRIAIVNETYTAGATRCALDLLNGLRAKGHEARYYPESTTFTKGDLLEELKSFRPHVVHLHSFYGHFEYKLIAELSRLYPTCFTPHDPRPMGTMEVPCWECAEANTCFKCPMVSPRRRSTVLLNPYYRQRWEKRMVHRQCSADLFFAYPSAWIRERFRGTELGRFPSELIPYGIDVKGFQPIKNAKQLLGWPDHEQVILYLAHSASVGVSNPRKGLYFLTTAFVEQVLPNHPAARLAVIGEGLVGNHPQIKGLGFVSHELLPLYYSAADMFVCPTLADNLPYSVLEAMACGKPVIASRVGGVAEEVEQDVTGLLVEKANVQELAVAISRLLSDPAAAIEMGRQGRNRIERNFSMEDFICRYESLYKRLSSAASDSGIRQHPDLLSAEGDVISAKLSNP